MHARSCASSIHPLSLDRGLAPRCETSHRLLAPRPAHKQSKSCRARHQDRENDREWSSLDEESSEGIDVLVVKGGDEGTLESAHDLVGEFVPLVLKILDLPLKHRKV